MLCFIKVSSFCLSPLSRAVSTASDRNEYYVVRYFIIFLVICFICSFIVF